MVGRRGTPLRHPRRRRRAAQDRVQRRPRKGAPGDVRKPDVRRVPARRETRSTGRSRDDRRSNLRIYVVWAPNNGGRQQDVGRVTQIVTDPRAAQYWDGHRVLTDAYDRMLALSGPCAGIFMLYGRQARWAGATPPRADYLEDAHAEEFHRPYRQYDPQRFADKAREMLSKRGN